MKRHLLIIAFIFAPQVAYLQTINLNQIRPEGSNTVLGNATSGTASPTALPVPSCSANNDALIWTTNSGFGCNPINIQALGGPPVYQSSCYNTSGTPTVTCTLNITSGDLLLALAADDCYGIASSPPVMVLSDNQTNTWFTDAQQTALYINAQGSNFVAGHAFAKANGSLTLTATQSTLAGCTSRIELVDFQGIGVDTAAIASNAIAIASVAPSASATSSNEVAVLLTMSSGATTASPGSQLFALGTSGAGAGFQFTALNPGTATTSVVSFQTSNFPAAALMILRTNLQYSNGTGSVSAGGSNKLGMYSSSTTNNVITPSGVVSDAAGDLQVPGVIAAKVSTKASSGFLNLTTQITHITGTTALSLMPPPALCGTSGYGCVVTLIADGAFSWATGGGAEGFAANGYATVGQAVTFIYDTGTQLWYQFGGNPYENVVAFSATPTFSATSTLNTITLTGNVTSSTLAAGTPGFRTSFLICQDATGSRTFVWPANVRGGMAIGSTLSKCSAQEFIYSGSASAWLADSPGQTNQ